MDEQIRKNYGQASPGDLIPDFDREAMWGQIQTRLEKPAAKRVFLRWSTYAAAAVAGALLMLLLQPAKEGVQTLSAIRVLPQQHVSPALPISPVTVKKESAPEPVAAAARKAANPAAATIAPAPVSPEQPAPIAAVLTDTIGPRHIVATRLPVKHLLDLGNEDRRLMDDGSFPGAAGSRIIELNKPGSSSGNQPDLAFRRLFKTGND